MYYIFRIKSEKLLISPTIQKPYDRQFLPIGFATTLKPDVFEGANYKRWRARVVLWLAIMSCFHASRGKHEEMLTPQPEEAFEAADNVTHQFTNWSGARASLGITLARALTNLISQHRHSYYKVSHSSYGNA